MGRSHRWALLLLPALLPLAGCKTTVVRRSVERRLERRLEQELGPADRYQVKIRDTVDSELVRGRARRVEIHGRNVYVRRQFLIQFLRLSLEDLRYEGEEPYLVSIRRSDLQIEFTDSALNDYLRAYHARYNPEVRFEPGRVRVKMVYSFLGTPTPLQAVGRFEVVEGKQLVFRAEQADVSFIDQPGFGERFVEDRVNPLLDVTRIDFPARLESVQVLQGRIKAHGTAAIPR